MERFLEDMESRQTLDGIGLVDKRRLVIGLKGQPLILAELFVNPGAYGMSHGQLLLEILLNQAHLILGESGRLLGTRVGNERGRAIVELFDDDQRQLVGLFRDHAVLNELIEVEAFEVELGERRQLAERVSVGERK